MTDYTHPDPAAPGWDDPDFCPFRGGRLTDPGAGVVDHLDAAETCRRRFVEWSKNIAGDVNGEWSG